MTKVSAASLQKLIKQLETQSDTKAAQVIAKLGEHGVAAHKLLLEVAQDDAAPRPRKWAILALGELKVKKSASICVEALSDERMTIRLNALRALAKLKHKKSAKSIAAMLNDESGGIRVNALYALMELKDDSVSGQIIKTLSDQQWYVRQTAAEACEVLMIQKSRKKLKELATEDERKAVRVAATKALSVLQK